MDKLERAIALIDAWNDEDPTRVVVGEAEVAEQTAYARRMTEWLGRIAPNASEALQLAVRAQHVQRWAIPRDAYPMDRDGYKAWRASLAMMHADLAAKAALEAGYDEVFAERVSAIVRKHRFKVDPEAQTLEDVACLVFLEHYFADFRVKHDEAKLVTIVQKTWKKMSEVGQRAALGIALGDAERAIVEKALAGA